MSFNDFLTVRNDNFIYSGKAVLLKSIGLGSWLNLEHMMVGIPGTHTQIIDSFTNTFGKDNSIAFWEEFYTSGVVETDIAFIKSKGFNSVRIAINHHLFLDHENFSQTTAIRHVDRILNYCEKYNIWAVIDLHSAPGGQNPDWHSDNSSGDYGFWKNAASQEQIVALWKQIASYYQDSKVVAGYDLINEPCYFEKELDETLLKFSFEVTRAIRSVDKNHIIFYEGNTYSRDFTMFTTNMDENCCYTFHFYPFLQIEELIDDEKLNSILEKQLNADISLNHIRNVLKKPIWCGETGHPHHLHKTKFALNAFLKLLESQNISWALWPYKDKGAMGYTHLAKNSVWNLKMDELSESWNFFDFFKQDSAVAIQQESDKMKYYRDMADFATKGLDVFSANLKNVNFEDLQNLLAEFRLENMVLDSFSMLDK